MKRRSQEIRQDWQSEQQSRLWLAALVQTFDEVAESRTAIPASRTPKKLRAQLLRPGAPSTRRLVVAAPRVS